MRDRRQLIITIEADTALPLYVLRRAHLLVTGEVPDVHTARVTVSKIEERKLKKPKRRRE